MGYIINNSHKKSLLDKITRLFKKKIVLCKKMNLLPIFFILISVFLLFSLADPLYAATGNLLSNAGFETQGTGDEQDAANWEEVGDAGRQNWANHTDLWGMAMYNWGTTSGEAYQEVDAAEGVEYTFTLWTLTDGGELTGSFYMKLTWYDSTSTEISTDSSTITVTDSWAQKTLTATAPANTAKVRVRFGSITVNLAGKFDDASLTADAYVWDGGGANTNFSTNENWVGDYAPSTNDSVVFGDANSTNCVLDIFNLGDGDFTVVDGYGGDFTSSGEFICDAATLDLSNATASWSISNEFNTGRGNDNGALTISAGTFTTSGPMWTDGNITLSGDATISQTANYIVMRGQHTKTISNSGSGSITFYKLEENSDTSAGSTYQTTINCNVAVTTDVAINNDGGGQTGDGKLILTGGKTLDIGGKFENKGSFTSDNASNVVQVAGDIDLDDANTWAFSDSGTFEWDGTLDKELYANSDSSLNHFHDFKISGSAQLKVFWDGAGTTVDGDFLQTGGTFWMDNNNVFTVDGTTTISSGTFKVGKSATLTGDVANSGTVELYGNALLDLTVGSGNTFTNSGTVQVTDDTNAITLQGDGGQFTYTGTEIDYNAKSITFKYIDYDPNVNLASGETIVIGDANCEFDSITINSGGTLDDSGNYNFNVSGDWSNSGTFTQGTSTVTLNGTNQSISGTTTFYGLTKEVATAYTLTFENGTTQTIDNSLTLQGASGNLLSLRSDSSPTQYNIDLQAGATQSLSYLNVKDSVASGLELDAGSNSTDSLNNDNWVFNGTTYIWDGSTDTNWDINSNWNLGAVPSSSDTVVITVQSNEPKLASNVTVNNLTVNSDATLDLNGHNLTVSTTVSNDGTIILQGDEAVSWTNDTSGTVKYDGSGDYTSASGLVAGDSYYNLEFDNALGSWDLGANLDVNGTFNLTNGTFDMNDKNMNVAGNFTLASGTTFTKGTGTLTFDGDLNFADNTSPQQDLGAVAIGTSPDTTTLTTNKTASSLIINEGDKLITNGYNLYISGDLTVNGTLDASDGDGGTTTIEVGGDWIIGPNGSVIGANEKMKISKDANKKEANVGDVITYTITIENNTSVSFTSDVTIEDTIPGGFKYISDSAQLDGSAISNPTGNRPLSFNVGTISKGTTKILRYQLVIGSGVTFGSYENTAVAKSTGGTVVSNTASETVMVVPDPLFDLGTIIGKVFLDLDEDGIQVKGETGIANVNIVTEDGAVITTDKNGKYHLKAIQPGRHVLRIDESTLPQGYYLTTEKAVIVDITEGLLTKVNFGVNTKEKGAKFESWPVRIIQKKETPKPILNVSLYPQTIISYEAGQIQTKEPQDKYEFRIFTNYPLFIKEWKIEILDKNTKKVVKTFTGSRSDLSKPILWDGTTDKGGYLSIDKSYLYTLTVKDKRGDINKTKEKKLYIVSCKSKEIKFESKEEEKEKKAAWLEKENRANSLKTQNIKIEGDVILIESEKTFESSIKEVKQKISLEESRKLNVKIDDTQIPLIADNEKKISQEVIIPKGEHGVVVEFVDENGEKKQYTKDIGVKENYLFFVGLGDAKVGYTVHKGSIEPIKHDDKYRDGFWSEGKLAYYLKGKLKGKYLITSSLDTDRDKKELFRNLDPDKFYPVYGDASTVDYKATDTQGALYLLVEWDKSSLLWGNYKTGLTDAEFAQFSRTLYGAKIDYESVAATKFGEPKTKLIVFHAKAQQKAAHNEFTGTGGSLFYLKNKDVVEGSEKVKLEARDKTTGLVLASEDMQEDSDYEIDYENGRIIFWKPVSSIAESSSIISSSVLSGNLIYVVVDYEYETKDKYAEGTVGARLEQAVTDYLRVGGTYVNEEQTNKNYELKGTDVTVHLGENTEITAEYAESESDEVNSYISTDGGLSFTQLATGDDNSGRAYGLKGKSYLFDNKLGITTYYKKIEKNFSSTSTVSQQGKELTGAEVTYDISSNTRIKAKHDIQELIDGGNQQTSLQVGASKTETTSAQVTHKKDKLTLTGEYRHQDVEEKIEDYESETNQEEQTIAAKAEYELSDKTIVSLKQQATLDGPTNNQTTAGIKRRLNDYLSLSAEETVGTKGSATTLGAVFKGGDKLEFVGDYTMASYANEGDKASITTRAMKDENTEVYHTYSMSETKNEGKKFASVFGTKERLSNDMELTMENEHSSSSEGVSNTNIFGLSGDVNDKLAGTLTYERGTVQHHNGDESVRNAVSAAVGYVDKDKIKASSKLEFRLDEGQEDKRQYLFHNAAEYKTNKDTTLFAKLNFSQSDNKTNDAEEGLYKEFVTGLAYRPLDNDRLNLIAKYSYLEDDSPSSQEDISDIEKEKAHVLAGECVYDLTDKWQLSEKLALKAAEERVEGFDPADTLTWLNVNRLRFNVNENWQVAGEYRFLRQQEADDYKQGALVEVARNIGDFVQVGVGYNFTDFNDDLTHLDYTSQGPFIRITGKLYDRSPEEKLRAQRLRLEEQIEKWAWSRVLNKTAKKDTPVMQELYTYYEKAKNLEQQGKLEQAKELYRKIISEAKSIYAEAEEYIKDHIELEKELKGNYQKAMEYYKSGRLKEARDLLQEIVNKAEGGIK